MHTHVLHTPLNCIRKHAYVNTGYNLLKTLCKLLDVGLLIESIHFIKKAVLHNSY